MVFIMYFRLHHSLESSELFFLHFLLIPQSVLFFSSRFFLFFFLFFLSSCSLANQLSSPGITDYVYHDALYQRVAQNAYPLFLFERAKKEKRIRHTTCNTINLMRTKDLNDWHEKGNKSALCFTITKGTREKTNWLHFNFNLMSSWIFQHVWF